MSENGWTDDFLCYEWFRLSFIPQATARNKSGKPIVLILDGHGSHEKLAMAQLAKEHNIILFSLPPHTTHMLQPLDVGVFGPFARAWIDRCNTIVEETNTEMPREDFVREYMEVRKVAFKRETILQAWRKCGIRPTNPDIFKDADYAPSLVTSFADRSGNVPPSFPVPAEASEEPNPAEEDIRGGSSRARRDDTAGDEGWETDDEEYEIDIEGPSADASTTDDDDINGPFGAIQVPEEMSASPIGTQQQVNARISVPQPTVSNSPTEPAFPPGMPQASSSQETPSPSSLSTPIPPSRFYCPSSHRPRMSTQEELQMLREQLRQRDEIIRQKDTRIEELTGHCALAYHEIDRQKRKRNSKEAGARKMPKLNVRARILTSEEGMAEMKKREDETHEKKEKQEAARLQREEKEREARQRRQTRDLTKDPLTGSLVSKDKTELQDVAYALALPTNGTKAELLAVINKEFEDKPGLRDDPRYSGMFSRARGKRPQQDENTVPHEASIGTPTLSSFPHPLLHPHALPARNVLKPSSASGLNLNTHFTNPYYTPMPTYNFYNFHTTS